MNNTAILNAKKAFEKTQSIKNSATAKKQNHRINWAMKKLAWQIRRKGYATMSIYELRKLENHRSISIPASTDNYESCNRDEISPHDFFVNPFIEALIAEANNCGLVATYIWSYSDSLQLYVVAGIRFNIK